MKNIIQYIIHDLFSISFFTFLSFFFLEYLYPGLITNYFNLNLLLLFCLSSGIIFMMMDREETFKRSFILKYYFFFLLLSFLTAVIVFRETSALGWIRYLIPNLSFFAIIFISIAIFKNYDSRRQN